ncbi:acetylornithine/acetyl-lysine aminotransferase [Streptomyces ruber]|uniref:Acetylornithine/acetyl-lysine aminotransferase n=2 Tax=Streptomyces TaxID=1883 RepID=A0A918ETM9_9ACTN|nr:aspartate aminotransferase family protein [Streptomyces ruber]GGQ60750.1 acetylornithine/acetyl-lysine aminotransferase [Streptomyces ruber]
MTEPRTTMNTAVADAGQTFRRVRRHFSPALAVAGKFTGQGAVEAAAEGCRVTLSDGRDVLDFGSYAVALLGHRNPAIVEAVRNQLDVLPASTRSVQNPVAPLAAERLTGYLGGGLGRVYFGCGGADAVETSVKLARMATGRTTVLAVDGAFHGKTLGALALTDNPRFKSGLEPLLQGVVRISGDDPGAVAEAAREHDVAAVVFEPVQAENGVRLLDESVLAQWCRDAHEHGAFVVADEIQVGLRRCGARSLALAAGLDVDCVLLGKPLGGGVLPVSAVVGNDRLFAPLLADPMLHTATFSGHPLSTAVIPTALDLIERHAEDGERIALAMEQGLACLREQHPDAVVATRGRGLLWGIDLRSPELAGDVLTGLAQRSMVVSPCLSRPATIRLLPPIVATDADVKEAMTLLSDAVAGAAVAAA